MELANAVFLFSRLNVMVFLVANAFTLVFFLDTMVVVVHRVASVWFLSESFFLIFLSLSCSLYSAYKPANEPLLRPQICNIKVP